MPAFRFDLWRWGWIDDWIDERGINNIARPDDWRPKHEWAAAP